MERDFLGLSVKELSPAVKEESKEGLQDSGMQWPFSNKVSALPQFMSFKTGQEDRSKKMVFDRLASSAFMPTISTADAFDANHKPTSSIVQKNFNLDRQVGTYNATNTYSVQHVDLHRPHDLRALPVPNQTISISMSNPFFKTHVATTGQSLAPTSMKQQPIGGIPVTTTHAIFPASGSVDPRNISKASGAQLTIFYGGAVNVYDDISPEKAQAIMFLAGNGASMSNNQRAQVQAPTSQPTVVEGVQGNQSPNSTPPCSGLPSPISVTSHSGAQSGSGSSNNDEGMATKSKGTLIAPSSSQPEVVTPIASAAPTTLMPAAVPQARKASLARFLEKRKERIMTVAPYSPSNKSTESTKGSLPFPANKEQSWSMGPTKMEANNAKLHST
ncbi:protein TIFY 6B-like isoform X2 [Macadamia integrifolia]|uniref:protein TIFY 6B-like isoform X2 n=1 Tax=Macadamia integrifolia TaxID=60698 RepID=UPI001C4EB790|nr:protein TIFY 6B-like isoform X2 [Macadamia integrifolia]